MDSSDLYERSIILIGPSGSGKTTVGRELARLTGMRQVSLDGIANGEREYRRRFPTNDDYKLDLFSRLIEDGIKHNACGIVDFGAGHSIFQSEEKFLQAQEILGSFRNIILLRYSKDDDETLRVINARSTSRDKTLAEDNERFITSGCNERLATMIVYTKDKTPEEIAGEILERIKTKSNSK